MERTVNKNSISASKIFIYIFLVLLSVVYIAPLLWMFSVSIKTNSEIFSSPFALPQAIQWENYQIAWSAGKLGIAMFNSFAVCGITLIVSMFVGAMAAFAIGRMNWKLSGITLVYFLLGMMIPVHCLLIPLFVSFSKVGLTNSLLGLILPYVTFSLPLTIFIVLGFFRSIPKEMFESACMDGCSIYGCFLRIAIPMAKTGLFVAALMTFVNNWNELLLAMVFISDVTKKTLPVTLTYFAGPYATNYVQMFAAIVISIAPTICVYSAFSNQIVEGLTAGAVKG
ncbi:MAG: carbohydrate ABC transporter permease [Acetanaerobacterium sp.]